MTDSFHIKHSYFIWPLAPQQQVACQENAEFIKRLMKLQILFFGEGSFIVAVKRSKKEAWVTSKGNTLMLLSRPLWSVLSRDGLNTLQFHRK